MQGESHVIDQVMDEMSASEQSTTSRNVATTGDVEMVSSSRSPSHSDDTNSIPDLMELSDSSDSSSESESVQSTAEELEVLMQAVDDGQNTSSFASSQELPRMSSPIPTVSESRPTATRSHNRRARVEDDEDEERDRRHPSQRISSPPTSQTSSPSPSTSRPQSQPRQAPRMRTTFTIPSVGRVNLDPADPHADPLRFFQHFMPQHMQAQQDETNPTANNSTPSAVPQPSQQPADVNTAPSATGAPPQAPQNQPHGGFTLLIPLPPPLRLVIRLPIAHPPVSGNEPIPGPGDMAFFTEIMMRLGLLGALFGGISPETEGDDSERARRLVDGLEEVPIGLVRRLARVGGTEDADGSRDTMCAICWDQLLDEAGFGKKTEEKVESPESTESSESDTSSTSESSSEGEPKDTLPKVVALPCAHVFHAECLIPWFSRPKQTTCPTCRFNIDPENITRSRRRRAAPMRPAGPPNTQTGAAAGQQQPAQREEGTTQQDNDNANPRPAGQDNNRPATHFMFNDMRIPIVVATPPFISVNVGDTGATGNNDGEEAGNQIDRDILDQLRAAVEAHSRAGRGNQQPSTGADAPTTNPDPELQDMPPTEPVTPVDPPAPAPQPGAQAQQDNHGVTTSIVFGIDVVVSGTIRPGGPRTDGNMMDIDEGGGHGNWGSDDGDQNWFGMMMGGSAPANANTAAAANNTAEGRTNVGQENANPGAAPNGGDASGQNQALPRFFNMNLGNGESLHIASGMGRTMSEAMAHLLSSMGGGNQATPANTNTNTTSAAPPEPAPGPVPNPNPASSGASNVPQPGPTGTNQAQAQNQQNQAGGGTFPGMATLPLMMTQLFGLASPFRVFRRQGQGQNQQTESNTAAADTPSVPSQTPDGAQSPQTTDAASVTEAQPEQTADANPPQPPPPTGNGSNTNNGPEGLFAQLIRQLMAAGAVPMGGAMGAGGQADIPFFPAGFTVHTDPPSSNAPSQPSEKRPWTPPPAPGPTLRQRIEKREREIGLRCCDMSCGVGPSDDDPLIAVTAEQMKQLTLRPANTDGKMAEGSKMCPHTFHPSCLVSSERVALRGAEAPLVGGDVEVSCSVCRAVGRVSRQEWDKGVQELS